MAAVADRDEALCWDLAFALVEGVCAEVARLNLDTQQPYSKIVKPQSSSDSLRVLVGETLEDYEADHTDHEEMLDLFQSMRLVRSPAGRSSMADEELLSVASDDSFEYDGSPESDTALSMRTARRVVHMGLVAAVQDEFGLTAAEVGLAGDDEMVDDEDEGHWAMEESLPSEQDVIHETFHPTEEWVFDYVCDLLDEGICATAALASSAAAAQPTTETVSESTPVEEAPSRSLASSPAPCNRRTPGPGREPLERRQAWCNRVRRHPARTPRGRKSAFPADHLASSSSSSSPPPPQSQASESLHAELLQTHAAVVEEAPVVEPEPQPEPQPQPSTEPPARPVVIQTEAPTTTAEAAAAGQLCSSPAASPSSRSLSSSRSKRRIIGGVVRAPASASDEACLVAFNTALQVAPQPSPTLNQCLVGRNLRPQAIATGPISYRIDAGDDEGSLARTPATRESSLARGYDALSAEFHALDARDREPSIGFLAKDLAPVRPPSRSKVSMKGSTGLGTSLRAASALALDLGTDLPRDSRLASRGAGFNPMPLAGTPSTPSTPWRSSSTGALKVTKSGRFDFQMEPPRKNAGLLPTIPGMHSAGSVAWTVHMARSRQGGLAF